MRQEIPIVVLGADGRPAAGASVYVRTDPGGADATIYQAKTGGATHGNPRVSDAQGRVEGWLERGDYAATITVAGLPPWVESFPIISALDVVPPPIFDTLANRPAVGLQVAGQRFIATDSAQEYIVQAGAWVPRGPALLTVAQFLGLPAQGDGTEVLVQIDAPTASKPGLNLRLRLNKASAHAAKWEVVGQAPELIADTTANGGSTGSVSYVTPVSAPTITLPLGGVVDIYAATAALNVGNATAATYGFLSYSVGAAGINNASDNDAASLYQPQANVPQVAALKSPTRRKTVAAGDIVTPRVRAFSAGSTIYVNNSLATASWGVYAKYVAVIGPAAA